MVTFISCSNCGTCHAAGMQWMLWQMFKCLPTLTQHASRYANWISGFLPIHGYSLLTIFFLYIIDRQVYSFLNSHAHIFVIINLYVVILIEIFFQTFAHCHILINKTSYCSKILTLQEQKVISLYAVSAIFNDQLIKILIKNYTGSARNHIQKMHVHTYYTKDCRKALQGIESRVFSIIMIQHLSLNWLNSH